MLAQGVRWFDDWYAIEEIAPGILAIGEPKYHQINWNYLIAGKAAALLFDTGPGVRDIRPVVAGLTGLPVIAMPSHMHFDHTGNLHRFADIAMADLPILRSFERDGLMQEPGDLYLGHYEDFTWTPLRVSHWWPISHLIDLGGVRLEIVHTPGHSPDSVSLLDRDRDILFAADFVYLGQLYAQVPGSNLPDYLDAAERLAAALPAEIGILCAHGKPDEQGLHRAPRLAAGDVKDLAITLAAVRSGRVVPVARNPFTYTVNPRMTLLASPASFGAWQMPA